MNKKEDGSETIFSVPFRHSELHLELHAIQCRQVSLTSTTLNASKENTCTTIFAKLPLPLVSVLSPAINGVVKLPYLFGRKRFFFNVFRCIELTCTFRPVSRPLKEQ